MIKIKGSMSQEEYSALKAEITETVNIQQNYIIAMYTMTAAFIGFAIQYSNLWLFVIAYIVLIPFQRIIDAKKYHKLKLSAILAAYSNDIWEQHYTHFEDNVFSPTYHRSFFSKFYIIRVSSYHLGALCSALCVLKGILMILNTSTVKNPLLYIYLPSFIAILLFCFIGYWGKSALDSYSVRQKYVDAVVADKAYRENFEEESSKKLTGYPSKDKPWLKYYNKETIISQPPQCSIYDYLWKNNKEYMSNIALNYFSNRITYHKMFEAIENTAKGFFSLGVRKGEIVTIISVNTPEIVFCIYALNIIGAISNLEYVTESEKEALAAVERCNSHTVVLLDVLIPKFRNLADSNIVKNIVIIHIDSSMPLIKRILYSFKFKAQHINKEISYNSLLNHGDKYEKAAYQKDAPAVIVHSGGTTGIPKGVVLSNENLNYIAWIFKNHRNDTQRGEKWLCAIPVFHAFGLAMGIIWPLSQGMQSVIAVKYNDKELVSLFIKNKPEHIIGSGAHIPSIQNSKIIQNMDLSFFKTCGLGGTPLSVKKEIELVEFLEKRNSIAKASIGYGMSETSSAISTELNRYYGKEGSAGIILCKSNVKVVDSDGTELSYNQTGELCFSGPGIMIGYYENEEETENAIFIDEQGTKWLHSGDLGYIDEDGFIFITGRKKRMYTTRAEKNGTLYKVFPDYIAKIISEVPNIEECAVICIEDQDYQNICIAFIIVAKDISVNYKSINKNIVNHIMEVLPKYCVPQKIIQIDQLPMTPVGKVNYQELEQMVKSTKRSGESM